MCTKTAAKKFRKKYWSRVNAQKCSRCGEAHSETTRKCNKCKAAESKWRKQTRKTKNRDISEQQYVMRSWAKRCVAHSRRADRDKGRTIEQQTYVTETQLTNLRKHQKNQCFYCSQQMQVFNRRRPDGLTVERVNGMKHPHDCWNCILACHRCNSKRLGNDTEFKPPLEMYYDIWKAFRAT